VLKETSVTVPDYIRLPPAGTLCPRTGLSRSALDLLCRPQAKNSFAAPVKSRLVKLKGDRLIRLINYPDLLRFIRAQPDGGRKENLVPCNANVEREKPEKPRRKREQTATP